MTTPGFSITEIIQAAHKLKLVYDAFFDKYENAESRVRELSHAIDVFHFNLINHEWILQRSGRHYPGHGAFRRTLEECDEFIKEYRSLLDKKAPRTQKAWKTTCWPFEEGHVNRLIRQLNTHVQAMAGFTLNLLL